VQGLFEKLADQYCDLLLAWSQTNMRTAMTAEEIAARKALLRDGFAATLEVHDMLIVARYEPIARLAREYVAAVKKEAEVVTLGQWSGVDSRIERTYAALIAAVEREGLDEEISR
jgi:hypothetical protein